MHNNVAVIKNMC